MPSGPALPDPGRDEDPARRVPEPDDFPGVGSERWRFVPAGPDWMDDAGLREAYLAALIAGAREITAAGFANGTLLDRGPGCTALMGFADSQAGDDDRYVGACDDELVGAICAWDRVEAHAAARKHAAVAELIR